MNQIKTARDNIQSLSPPKKQKASKKKKRIVKRGWQKSISLSNEQKQRLICIEILTLRQSSTIELLLGYRSNIIFLISSHFTFPSELSRGFDRFKSASRESWIDAKKKKKKKKSDKTTW